MFVPNLTNVKLGLKPYIPLSMASRLHPTRAATAAPTAEPRKAANAEILEQSMMPTKISSPATKSSARYTCPTPRIDPAKNAFLLVQYQYRHRCSFMSRVFKLSQTRSEFECRSCRSNLRREQRHRSRLIGWQCRRAHRLHFDVIHPSQSKEEQDG